MAVIPARLGSSRLPDKPLHLLLGRPLVEWTWRRVSEMDLFDSVVVATDSPRIVEACRSVGAPVVLTDPDHPTGTDRIAEVVGQQPWSGFDLVVNVQGDEPMVEEAHLEAAVELVRGGGWPLATTATPIRSREELANPDRVKAVRGRDGRALYFTRAPAPWRRDGLPTDRELATGPWLRHLGIYVYRREALLRWVDLAPSPLEEIERLEQLRPLESGLAMGIAVVDRAAPGVDTPEDVVRMEGLLAGNLQTPTSHPRTS
ncbi:MAG: 3-deoxy-manno-octulosonate cytidylyltransferase [Gemmatimonadales bacterium]|nr:MAG: 3-deoxy-manno-octulosonate cytidylyltransferase [Gemmatimonadales bacterium]